MTDDYCDHNNIPISNHNQYTKLSTIHHITPRMKINCYFLTKTNTVIHNGHNNTRINSITAISSGKYMYPDTNYRCIPLDELYSDTLYQNTAQKYMM